MNWVTRYLLLVPLFASAVVVGDVHAAVLIDDFTTAQSVLNGTTGPVNVTGTQLSNLTRIIAADAYPDDAESAVASPGHAEAKALIKNGFLKILNDSDSIGTASVFYSFDATDLTSVADRFLLKISFIDLSAEIQLIANETSVFDFANFWGQPEYEVDFDQFSNPDAFTNLTSLRLNFRGAQSWDARFGSLVADSNHVPEPATLFLLTFGLAALGQSRLSRVVKSFAKLAD